MSEAGALAWRARRLAFFLTLLPAGCRAPSGEPPPTPSVLVVDGDTIILAAGARIMEVSVRAGGAEFDPDSMQLQSGDVIRFTAQDRGPHAIVFEEAETDAAGQAFLEATGQSRGVPLLSQDAAWVVSLMEAPGGRYTVRCLTHGAVARIDVATATGSVR